MSLIQDKTAQDKSTGGTAGFLSWRKLGLSGKLLLLTIPLVMIAEVLIYVPSMANFLNHNGYDCLAAANTAALGARRGPERHGAGFAGARQILDSIGAHAVAIKHGQQRRLLAIGDMPAAVERDIDTRAMMMTSAIYQAFEMMLTKADGTIRIVGPTSAGGQFIEVVVDEMPLKKAMYRFSINLVLFSLAISILTACFVYLALHYLFVRPMRRMTANCRLPRQPGKCRLDHAALGPRRRNRPGRTRTLGNAARPRLDAASEKPAGGAGSGGVEASTMICAVLLASAQLISDQLATVPDPRVQRFAPKLMRSLERAIAFCQSTLSYGVGAGKAAPDRRTLALDPIVNEVRELLGLGEESDIAWVDHIERGLTVDADPDQLFLRAAQSGA